MSSLFKFKTMDFGLFPMFQRGNLRTSKSLSRDLARIKEIKLKVLLINSKDLFKKTMFGSEVTN